MKKCTKWLEISLTMASPAWSVSGGSRIATNRPGFNITMVHCTLHTAVACVKLKCVMFQSTRLFVCIILCLEFPHRQSKYQIHFQYFHLETRPWSKEGTEPNIEVCGCGCIRPTNISFLLLIMKLSKFISTVFYTLFAKKKLFALALISQPDMTFKESAKN